MSAPLLVVIGYCQKDLSQTERLLKWIGELGGCRSHSCLLVADSEVPKDDRIAIKALATPFFYSVASIPLTIPAIGYAPNHMFMLAAKHVMFSYKLPWLWLEPDAVPLKPGWLNALSDEYAASPKRFLGGLIESTQPGLPPVHLTGVAIYPTDAFLVYDKFASIKSANVTWDMDAASDVVPRAANSKLMQHFWGKRDLPPTFVLVHSEGDKENAVPLSFIKPESVLWHRNKDGTLIELLRQKLPAAPRRGRPPKQQASNQPD